MWRRQNQRKRDDWHPDAIRTKDTGEVPVRWKAGLSDAQADALAVADNKLGEKTGWDKDLLADLLTELPDPELLGFSESELDRIVERDEFVEVNEVEVSETRVEFFLTATGDITSQPEVLDRLRVALNGIDGIQVSVTTSGMP